MNKTEGEVCQCGHYHGGHTDGRCVGILGRVVCRCTEFKFEKEGEFISYRDQRRICRNCGHRDISHMVGNESCTIRTCECLNFEGRGSASRVSVEGLTGPVKTLRDEFAMAALPWCLEKHGSQHDFALAVHEAFAVADEAMIERYKNEEKKR